MVTSLEYLEYGKDEPKGETKSRMRIDDTNRNYRKIEGETRTKRNEKEAKNEMNDVNEQNDEKTKNDEDDEGLKNEHECDEKSIMRIDDTH